MVNWLHISDLHLGSGGTITNIMRDELPIYLKRLGVKCDYVFCTGDICKPQKKKSHFGKNKMPQKCDKLSSILTFPPHI